jgi:hypothetical protein
MIQTQAVGGNQYEKARRLMSPVVVADSCTFRVPSDSRGKRDHKIQLDDPERPAAISCTCEAGAIGKPCWAMARVLDALEVLRANNVYVNRGAHSSWAALQAAASAVSTSPAAGIVEGDLALIWGDGPQAGVLYNIPN